MGRKTLFHLCFIISGLLFSQSGFTQIVEKSAAYHNFLDSSLSIHRISVFPIGDNLGGIYGRPIEKKIAELIENNHHWDYENANFVGPIPSLEELEKNPDKVKQMSKGLNAEAFVIARMIKGPRGISVRMNLFLTKTGRLLAQETLKDHPRFELSSIEGQIERLFNRLVAKIPYSGLVLSRNLSNRVTLNLGKRDGVAAGQTVTAVQIIRIHRHPKFDFVLSTEKETLGSIKIVKVDDTLSFGSIITEKERGAIRKGTKVAASKDVNYDTPDILTGSSPTDRQVQDSLDNEIVFGKKPKEWIPKKPPTFGEIALQLGFGSFSSKATLSSSGSLDGSSNFSPQVSFEGEAWINPNWALRFGWAQGIASTDNPLSGSSPDSLSHSISALSFLVGYNFLLQDDFFGPKIQVGAGFARYSDSVDDSTPTSLTSITISGFTLNLRGQLPVTRDQKWQAGLDVSILIRPGINETPVTSGASASNSGTDLKFFAKRKLGQNLMATGTLNFRLTRSTFTGTGTRTETATTASQRYTSLLGGIIYMF